jgi:hypothetical protein
VELVIGVTGFFASYKEAFIIILIALLASGRRSLSVPKWAFAVASAIAVVWVSLVWTAVKMEYRYSVLYTTEFEERIDWLTQRFFGYIDYSDALLKLFGRIGYTELYAQVLARQDAGAIPTGFNLYASAVQHVFTPRILFPDKPFLDDSQLTRALLDMRVAEGTSIGVGYVAQAQIDFGFPGLLLPVLFIGIMIGLAAEYFMTRPVPLVLQEAFTTAALFLSFPFASNIDKALGGFAMSCLVMSMTLRFGYPIVAQYLVGPTGVDRKWPLVQYTQP